MKPRTLVIFTIVTALVTAAALVSVAERYWVTTTTTSVTPFPGLLNHINDVAEIDVKTAKGTTVIKRDTDGWMMASKYGYPVQADMVKHAAIGFGEMEFTERKTSRPERYARLGVDDPNKKDAKSSLVTLKDDKGKQLAQLIVGHAREVRVGGPTGIYVRLPKDAQAWFTPADFHIPANPAVWLEPRIIHIGPKRVARITTVQPNGDTLVIYKDAPDTPHFAFKDLPPDKPLKGEAAADEMNTILAGIDLADVAQQSDVDFSKNAWHAKVETFDGLVVDVDLVDRSGEIWAKFAASTEKPLADLSSEASSDKGVFLTPKQVAIEAKAINARVGKWAYQLQKYQGLKMQADLQIFLANETPEQDTGSMGGFGPTPGGTPHAGGEAGGPPPPGAGARQ